MKRVKSKLPALILALGISTTPVFAKQSNRRADSKSPSKIEQEKLAQKRAQNTFKRKKQIEFEKEYIKETELEIKSILNQSY